MTTHGPVYAGQGTWDNGEVMDPGRATTADETLNNIVAWLRDCLNKIEGVAREAGEARISFQVVDLEDQPYTASDGYQETVEAITEVHREPVRLAHQAHAALHDPRAVLARVEVERRILQLWEEPDADAWLDLVVIDLAYGHRFDIPGYDNAWAPKWAGDAP